MAEYSSINTIKNIETSAVSDAAAKLYNDLFSGSPFSEALQKLTQYLELSGIQGLVSSARSNTLQQQSTAKKQRDTSATADFQQILSIQALQKELADANERAKIAIAEAKQAALALEISLDAHETAILKAVENGLISAEDSATEHRLNKSARTAMEDSEDRLQELEEKLQKIRNLAEQISENSSSYEQQHKLQELLKDQEKLLKDQEKITTEITSIKNALETLNNSIKERTEELNNGHNLTPERRAEIEQDIQALKETYASNSKELTENIDKLSENFTQTLQTVIHINELDKGQLEINQKLNEAKISALQHQINALRITETTIAQNLTEETRHDMLKNKYGSIGTALAQFAADDDPEKNRLTLVKYLDGGDLEWFKETGLDMALNDELIKAWKNPIMHDGLPVIRNNETGDYFTFNPETGETDAIKDPIHILNITREYSAGKLVYNETPYSALFVATQQALLDTEQTRLSTAEVALAAVERIQQQINQTQAEIDQTTQKLNQSEQRIGNIDKGLSEFNKHAAFSSVSTLYQPPNTKDKTLSNRFLEHADADAIPTPLQAYGQQQSAEAPKPTLIDELMANKADVTSPPTDSPERPLMSQNPANISLTPFS